MLSNDPDTLKCVDEIQKQIEHEWEMAYKNRLVLNQISKRRFIVIHINNVETYGFGCYFKGITIFGPETKENCINFIKEQVSNNVKHTNN